LVQENLSSERLTMKVRISYTVDVDTNARLAIGYNERPATREEIQRFYKAFGTDWREYHPMAEYEKEG